MPIIALISLVVVPITITLVWWVAVRVWVLPYLIRNHPRIAVLTRVDAANSQEDR